MFLQTKTSTVDILETLDKVCSPLLSCPFKPADFFQPLWPYHTSQSFMSSSEPFYWLHFLALLIPGSPPEASICLETVLTGPSVRWIAAVDLNCPVVVTALV